MRDDGSTEAARTVVGADTKVDLRKVSWRRRKDEGEGVGRWEGGTGDILDATPPLGGSLCVVGWSWFCTRNQVRALFS